ncbi:MAG: ribonuclease P protein component [Flavobacteriaceae bacterium]|nr:ribonuclease P protein component [Bacteroidia bacterium]MBT8286609.1 ribonuclease P protein component [Bacteroidia bacterium]NNF75134.1 ribonuclease P protein component [Flavobacteriaceae bacterium]NNK72150.1 ribonuclease P protein component [Flavobacteriaceae bacterium]
MKFNYGKKEKLKSRKLIDQLFAEGRSLSVYPLKLVYIPARFQDDSRLKAGVSVSKRNFKNAVTRNRVKRLIRESYRLNKSVLFNNMTTQYALMILYIGKTEPSFAEVNTAMRALLKKFGQTELS